MAVTITRTPWIDDDGSGTVGTVINNAVKTSLYNEIDAALAKVAQLAGGNAFTGNQSIAGVVTVSGAGTNIFNGSVLVNVAAVFGAGRVAVAFDGTVNAGLAFQNLNAGNTGGYLGFYNSALGLAGSISQSTATGVIYNTSSDARLKLDAGRATDLSALRAVVVHDFTWTIDGVRDRGIFAQEAHPLYPRAVTPGTDETTPDGSLARPWMTDYSKFVPDLIVGWQHHDAELAALRDQLAILRG